MYYYFCAEYPAVIKFNGVYQGVLDGNVRSVNRSANSPLFVEICPLTQSENPCNLLLSDGFFQNPPPCVNLTDLKGGYLIKLQKTDCNNQFRVVTQLKERDFVATIFYEGGLNFSFENRYGIFTDKLPNVCDGANITPLLVGGIPLLAVTLDGQKQIVVLYKIADQVEKALEFSASEVNFIEPNSSNGKTYYMNADICDDTFDVAKHRITYRLENADGIIKLRMVEIKTSENFCIDKLSQKILPYAFFEEALVGGKIEEYLCQNLKPNADKIVGFLGEFIGVMPPPPFRSIDEVGLIKKEDGNKYAVDYYRLTFENGKISNLDRLDY